MKNYDIKKKKPHRTREASVMRLVYLKKNTQLKYIYAYNSINY